MRMNEVIVQVVAACIHQHPARKRRQLCRQFFLINALIGTRHDVDDP